MMLNPEIEIELVFDDKELDLSTRQADIGIFMRRPKQLNYICLLYTSPSPRDPKTSRMPSSA